MGAREDILVESLAYGGDGVGRLADGRVVFVSGTCPGDTATVDVVRDRERYATGRLVEVVEPSGSRVAAPCPEAAAGRCGGCPWAHVAYECQLEWKRRAVVDALTRIARLPGDLAERLVARCVGGKRQWHYRNKVEFEVGQDVAGRFTLGAHAAAGAFDPLSSCMLCADRFADAPKALTGALRYALGRSVGELGVERVGLRASRRTGDVEVAIWSKPGRFPRAAIAKTLPQALPAKRLGITRVLVKGASKERKVSGTESLAGRGFWTEQVCGRSMAFSAPSFFQVNTAQAEKLVGLVMEALAPGGLDAVLDLYSGAGTFTLPLAAEAMRVVAVEAAGSSVRDLRRNLEGNGLDAEVVGGDVARELPGLGAVDAAVVDPPRSGLSAAALDGLLATGARRIAYVSCNPTTLARDLRVVLERGDYRVEGVTPVDLFPQSYHVESVAVLERVKG